MSVPAVTLNELDGQIGVLPSGTKIVALLGVSDSGPLNTPAAFARRQGLISTFTAGPLPEFGAYHVSATRQPVLACRIAATVPAFVSEVTDESGLGAVVNLDGYGNAPANDDYEIVWLCVRSGTIGETTVAYKLSFDGGRTYGPVAVLADDANVVPVPGSGGLEITFDPGPVVAGDTVSFRSYAPQGDSTSIVAGLEALRLSAQAWDVVLCSSPLDATSAAAVALKMAEMPTKTFLGCFRMPGGESAGPVTETEADYLAAFVAAFGDFADTHMGVSFGAAKSVSSVSGRVYRRPVIYSAGPRIATLSEELDAAWIDLGALPGVEIRDSNGNPDEHDETINPGADDARAIALRTFDGGPQGVYINNPRLVSATGSDFEFVQHRRVMNLAKVTIEAYLKHRLSQAVLVSAKTGFILESDALEIESGARAALRSALRAKPKASAVDFTLSRTDNILSTKTLTGVASVVPLAYPKAIEIDVGFRNPALQTVSVP